MVLLPQFSLTTFQTLEYSVKRRGGTFVHHIEEVQNECGEDYKEIYIKILLQQVQRFDPTPITGTWEEEESCPKASPLTSLA